jgi:lysyl-tRNA synthetase class II
VPNDRKFEEEEYMDVLQNIEFGIVNVYRQHPDLTDWDTLDAIEALIHHYTAEARGRSRPPARLSELPQLVFDFAGDMCEWRLGRTQPFTQDDQPVELEMEPKTVPEIIACLKRIRKSIRNWTKRGGRQGYLNFISEYIR